MNFFKKKSKVTLDMEKVLQPTARTEKAELATWLERINEKTEDYHNRLLKLINTMDLVTIIQTRQALENYQTFANMLQHLLDTYHKEK